MNTDSESVLSVSSVAQTHLRICRAEIVELSAFEFSLWSPVAWGNTNVKSFAAGFLEKQRIPQNLLRTMLLGSYREFEKRAGMLTTARGAKIATVLDAIERLPNGFRMIDVAFGLLV